MNNKTGLPSQYPRFRPSLSLYRILSSILGIVSFIALLAGYIFLLGDF